MISANITELLATYIHALHILHFHGVLDGYGHLSVRNPDNPPTFFLMGRIAPALVSGPEDIGEFRVSDAEPVRPGQPQPPIERYIHSEVLKRYPDVNVVLHGHPQELVSYSISDVPVRPGILDMKCPVFDITKYLGPNDNQTLLVNTPRLGAALAAEFDPCYGHAAGHGTHNQCLDSADNKWDGSQDGGSDGDQNGGDCACNSDGTNGGNNSRFPAHNIVLMQSHGFAAVATNITIATFVGVNAVVQAKIQSEALMMQHAYTGQAAQGDNGVVHLTPQQVRDGWEGVIPTITRAWDLWVREVEVDPLYVNKLDPGHERK